MSCLKRDGICAGMEGPGDVAESVGRGARELEDEAGFASIANGDGEVSICGFGSLLSGFDILALRVWDLIVRGSVEFILVAAM
jgi:hypothetical protein